MRFDYILDKARMRAACLMDARSDMAGKEATLVYVYENESNAGIYKIGQHNFSPYKDLNDYSQEELVSLAEPRVAAQHKTANVAYTIKHVEVAQSHNGEKFSDADIRRAVRRLGGRSISRKESKSGAQEWVEASLDTIRQAIRSVKDGISYQPSATSNDSRDPFVPRYEQEACARKIVAARDRGEKDFLVAAKPRFGKTPSILYSLFLAIEQAKQRGEAPPKEVAILTHRPDVIDGWARDARWIFEQAGIKVSIESTKPVEGVVTCDLFSSPDCDLVIRFLSIQDLRGRARDTKEFKERTQKFAQTEYDLLILDEAHEGIQTELAQEALGMIKRKWEIRATGTAYKMLADPDSPYTDKNTFVWDYVDEQKAKDRWYRESPGKPNPFACLPALDLHTLDLEKLVRPEDHPWFTLSEFWKVDDGKFIHDKEIDSFLDLLGNPEMPYCDLYREMMRHALWVQPSNKSAELLAEKLRKHPDFKDYEILRVSGDGESSGNQLQRVKKAIGDKPWETKTITLTVGRLTVGVTIPAWGGVLMLSDGESATSYVQAIFRAQSPCENAYGPGQMKTEAHIFDFSPDRTLKTVVEISSQGTSTAGEARSSLTDLTKYMPIMMYDGVKTSQLHSNQIMEEINTIFIERSVNNGLGESSAVFDMSKIRRRGSDLEDLLKEIRKAAAPGKNRSGKSEAVVSGQGLKPEGKTSSSTNSNSSKLSQRQSDPDRERLKREASIRRDLSRISIALPRLILGADMTVSSADVDKLDLDGFPDLFSDHDWEAFLGNVDKDLFRRAIPLFNEDVLRGSLKRFLLDIERAQTLDDPTERSEAIMDVLSRIQNPEKEVVFTPRNVAELVYDEADISFSEGSPPTLYDQNIKSGIFPLIGTTRIAGAYDITFEEARGYVYGNAGTNAALFTTLRVLGIERDSELADNFTNIDPLDLQERYKPLLKKTPEAVYEAAALTLLALNKGLARRHGQLDLHADALDLYENEKWGELLELVRTIGDEMKFDYVIGNPPYTIFSASGSGTQVYLDFLMQAAVLGGRVGSVFLSSWHNNKPLAKKREQIRDLGLATRVRSLRTFESSAGLFPTISDQPIDVIALGPDAVASTLFFRNSEEAAYMAGSLFSDVTGFVLTNVLQDSIIKKVTGSRDFAALSPEDWLNKLQNDVYVTSGGRSTEAFRNLLSKKASRNRQVRVGIPGGGNIEWLYGDPKVFKTRVPDGKCALAFSHASHHTNEITNDRQLICLEREAVKSTMPVFGDSLTEVYRLWKYSRTKIFSYLAESRLTSHHTMPQAYAHVPVQDLSDSSPIDWSGSVAEINEQLMTLYGLSKAEKKAVRDFEYTFSHPLDDFNRDRLLAGGVELHEEDKKPEDE